MLGTTAWLTLATLAGLMTGFAREWLLVSAWGAGTRSDAFLIAFFLPEAVRMTLAGGIFGAAALPLYQERDTDAQRRWITCLVSRLTLLGVVLSLALYFCAPWLIRLFGPGLPAEARLLATHSLQLLVWCIPGFFLQALFAIPLQAASRFTLVGLGSFVFNLPPVLYLAINGNHSEHAYLALACCAGSILMPLILLPAILRRGWRPWHQCRASGELMELARRFGPLLASNAASQGLTLLERMAASFLGEGAVTLINLARKFINLPLVALMSLNQVLFGLMTNTQNRDERINLLRRGLRSATFLTLPTSLGLVGAAPTLVQLLLPGSLGTSVLPTLVAWFAVALVFGAWNALLARYSYADGDTHLPLHCELAGNALNVILLITLPWVTGLNGIPLAMLGGMLLTGFLLLKKQNVLHLIPWKQHWGLSFMLLLAAAFFLFPLPGIGLQLTTSTIAGAITLAGLVLWLRS